MKGKLERVRIKGRRLERSSRRQRENAGEGMMREGMSYRHGE